MSLLPTRRLVARKKTVLRRLSGRDANPRNGGSVPATDCGVLAKNGRAAVVLPDGTLFGEALKPKSKSYLPKSATCIPSALTEWCV